MLSLRYLFVLLGVWDVLGIQLPEMHQFWSNSPWSFWPKEGESTDIDSLSKSKRSKDQT